jgi:Protein of unknown function (DUF3604)
MRIALVALSCLLAGPGWAEGGKRLLWGDTHLHTSFSFDAFLSGNQTADPDTAYRWARGLPVIHPGNRTRVRIGTPLDFLVVSDHAEFLGGIRDIYRDGIQDRTWNPLRLLAYRYFEWRIRHAIDSGHGREYFRGLLPTSSSDPLEAARSWNPTARTPPGADVSARNAWEATIRAAEANDEPGRFTAFVGWEWSSTPGGANLHRVVVTDADPATAQRFEPFGSNRSPFPEDLWAWLERTSAETGAHFLAIPHNSNLSKGLMFSERTLRGEPIDADYARRHSQWERVAEVTQVKGDSETHPALSPDDEFADFERYSYYIQQSPEPYRPQPGDFLRSAFRTGLALESRIGVNPYRLGLIGSTDDHTGLSSAEEPNFWGKFAKDSIPENKQLDALAVGPSGWSMSASGLAAVWAEDNTRAAILGALRRREVYATTGPRIRVQVYGGWDFAPADLDASDISAAGAARGVPMGGELPPRPAAAGGAPSFLVTALKDPRSANLDRIQVVKGWLGTDGASHEKIFDVAWSGERGADGSGHLAPVGDTVDRAAGTWADTIGAPELRAAWSDPAFDPAASAFYYVRVLEIPTPRHSLYDAIALEQELPEGVPAVIQERAYTSPIWYGGDGG